MSSDTKSNRLMDLDFDIPKECSSIIKVIGVGGGGGNAVNHMFERGIRDVNFIICNTDNQALQKSPVAIKVQIGSKITEGLGAGSKPEVGKRAAEENIEDVMKAIGDNTKMVFISTGMGGGTGTGAAPVIAKACKDAGLLTIGVVTMPFNSEGFKRKNYAEEGLKEMKQNVDSMIVIDNEKLREMCGNMTISEAFAKADDVLTTAVKGIAEIITMTGHINVDFADVDTIMRDSGKALMGMGKASGEDRARKAIEEALNSPLLNSSDITGAKNILVNIASGHDSEITMDELGQITDYLNYYASNDVHTIQGITYDDTLGDAISVTVVATGFNKKETVTINRVTLETDAVPPTIISNKENEIRSRNINEDGQQSFDFQGNAGAKVYSWNISDMGPSSKEREIITKVNDTIKKEGYSKHMINDNIEVLENVPAYVRNQEIAKSLSEREPYSAPSSMKYSIDDEGPAFSKDNPYLNNNVD